jgi:hypothetical protein
MLRHLHGFHNEILPCLFQLTESTRNSYLLLRRRQFPVDVNECTPHLHRQDISSQSGSIKSKNFHIYPGAIFFVLLEKVPGSNSHPGVQDFFPQNGIKNKNITKGGPVSKIYQNRHVSSVQWATSRTSTCLFNWRLCLVIL